MKVRKCILIIAISLFSFQLAFADTASSSQHNLEASQSNQTDASSDDIINFQLYGKEGLVVNDKSCSAILDDDEQPYVDVASIFKNYFGYEVSCQPQLQTCQISTLPRQFVVTINAVKRSAIVNEQGKASKEYQFPPNSLLVKNGIIWLHYDQLAQLLPLSVTWTVKSYELKVSTDLPLLEAMKMSRANKIAKILSDQKMQAEKEKKQASIIPQQPVLPFNATLAYTLTENQTLNGPNQNSRQAQFLGIADIFKGTLQGSGTITQPKTGPIPFTWIYTLPGAPYFNQLQVGSSIAAPQTPFMGNYSVDNGIKFDKLQEKNSSLNFYYVGYALPGTEVDVWRDSTLVQVINVDGSGQFIINDDQAAPGDVYKLQYYYPDGTEKQQFVRYSSDNGLLLKQGHLDADIAYGRYNSGNQFYGHIGQSLFRYGVLPNLTMGIGTYYFGLQNQNLTPSIGSQLPNQSQLHYLDVDWQALESLNLQLDKMLNAEGYAVSAISNYFVNHNIVVSYRRLAADSPILQIPTSFDDYNAIKAFKIKDTYSMFTGKLRLQTLYEDNNLFKSLSTTASTSVNSYLSPSLTLGLLKNAGQNSNLTLSLSNTSIINAHSFLQATINGGRGVSPTQSLQYSYRKNDIERPFNISIGLSRAQGANQMMTSAGWNLSPNWMLSASYATSGQAMLSIAYMDSVSVYSKLQNPQDYAMGSISGKLLSPIIPGVKQQPIKDAKVIVGGKSTITDANGNYVVSGIPTGQVVYLTIDPDSLDPAFALENDSVALSLRPGTYIEYNPVLTTNIGLDGYVLSNDSLSTNCEVVAEREDKTGFERRAKVNDDGYFIIEKLTPGNYLLKLSGVKDPGQAMELVVKPTDDFISNTIIKWHYTPPQPSSTAKTDSDKKPASINPQDNKSDQPVLSAGDNTKPVDTKTAIDQKTTNSTTQVVDSNKAEKPPVNNANAVPQPTNEQKEAPVNEPNNNTGQQVDKPSSGPASTVVTQPDSQPKQMSVFQV